MPAFPDTSTTLLQKLAAAQTGAEEGAWARFFELYVPVLRRFVEQNDPVRDPDDVVQDVCLMLVGILRSGHYDREKSRFRSFLMMLARRRLVSLYRKDRVRRAEAHVSLQSLGQDPEIPAEQADLLDAAWAKSVHDAAVEHVLTKTALSAQSRAVYRALVQEGRTIADVAADFGIAENLVRQIRFRVDRRVEAIAGELAD